MEDKTPIIGRISPFGLPYTAHLAHIPSAFSLLGHHPAFPVSTLFGGLGEGALGHLPSSLAATSLINNSPGKSKSLLSTSKSSSKISHKSQHSSSSSSSSKVTVTKATTTIATTSTTTLSNSNSQKLSSPSPTHLVSGTSGISLLSGKYRHSSKSSSVSSSTSTSSSHHRKAGTNGTLPSSSQNKSSTSSSKSLSDVINNSIREQYENGANLSDSDSQSDNSSEISSLSNSAASLSKAFDDQSNTNHFDGLPDSPSKAIHIDGMKKKLIADQIRQRVQNKPIVSTKTSIMQPIKRGRGRPPKGDSSSPEHMLDHPKNQEELKHTLEANLKQQQIQLKMLRKIQAEKEKEDMLKAQKQHGSHGSNSDQSKINSTDQQKEIHGNKDKLKSDHHKSLLFNPSKDVLKPDFQKALLLSENKEKHSSTKHSQGSPLKVPDLKMSISREGSGNSLVAKFKTLSETSSDNPEEDSDNSDSDNSDSDSDGESDSDDSDSENELKARSSETGSVVSKRSADELSERGGTPTKRPRMQLDEQVLRVPLEQGWQRQTTILAIGKRGFIGDVLYFAPCGKKLKTIPDITRYLEKHNTTDLNRDHFSFNTKVNIGEFYEATNEQNEVAERMALVESKRQKMLRIKQQRGQRRKEKQDKQIQLAKQMMEQKLMRKMEQQGIQLQLVLEKKKQKDQMRLMREQEKLQRQEQLRIERDMRAQQILESNLMWYHLERERERKRQHYILVKALEAQKKQAERDRLKEEKMAEKRMSREKKMEQRRAELQFLRVLKTPAEDMELTDAKPLPEFPRIPGTQVDGNCLADLLMVLEFLHNFGDALGFDEETLPSMKSLQDGVTGKTEEDSEEYMSLAVTRLGQKIADVEISDAVVGEILRVFVIARNGGKNEMSEWLTHSPVESLTPTQKGSVLAFLCNELLCGKAITAEVDRHLDHMGDIRRDKWVVEGKLRRLRMIQAKKFHRPVPKPPPDGDNSMTLGEGDDSMSHNMSVSSKRGSEDEEEKDEDSGNDSDDCHDNNTSQDADGEMEEPVTLEDCEKQIEKLQKQHAQYREKVFQASHKVRAINFGQDRYKRQYWVLPCAGGVYVEGLESGSFTSDEIAEEVEQMETDNKSDIKKVKQENEQESNNNNDSISNTVKSETCCTDIKVEDSKMTNQNSETNSPQNCADLNSVKTEAKVNVNTEVQFCNGEITPSSSENNSAINQSNLFLQTPTSTKLSDLCNLATVKTESCQDESKAVVTSSHSPSLLFSPSSSPFLLSTSLPSTPNSVSVTTSTPLPEQQLLKAASSSNVSPLTSASSSTTTTATFTSTPSSTVTSETKPKFLSIDSLLKKEDTPSVQNDHFFPSPVFPVLPLTPDQMLKNFSDLSEQKPWFSILPRMPCDDLSLTTGSGQLPTSPFSTSPFLSPLPFRAFPVQSPSFASFQMGQLFGTPSDFSATSSTTSTPQVDTFKVPSTPRSETDTPSAQKMQRGWWRITNDDQIKSLCRCCHPRGIRERNLQKTLQKFMEFACESCNRGDSDVVNMESSDSSSDEEEEETEEKEEKDKEKTTEEKSEKTESENPEEESVTEDKKSKSEKKVSVLSEEDIKASLQKAAHQVELNLLEEVENLEERVASASLQIKGWKVPQRCSEDSQVKIVDKTQTELKENEYYPMEMARKKLLNLEPNIERRYMKPPLCKARVQINLASITANTINESRRDSVTNDEDDDDCEREIIERPEDIPSGLATWRNAVAMATSPAQLTLCVFQLNNAIAWEKSIMKVLCQICRKDDNEAMLLLCDGCDRGYHTYCFKPKMENIPDGDWYCYECISKATGEPCCIVCGKRTGKIVECDACPRAIHLDCLDPPLPRMPRKWLCQACVLSKMSASAATKRTAPAEQDSDDDEQTPKKRRQTNQKYKESYSNMWPCLTSSKRGECMVRCTVCSCDFSCGHGGKNDCKRHVDSKTHKELNTLVKTNKSMASFVSQKSVETDHKRAVTRAEVMMCEIIAEMNLPITAADIFNKAFKLMFPDSKIAQDMKCARNKATAIILDLARMNQNSLSAKGAKNSDTSKSEKEKSKPSYAEKKVDSIFSFVKSPTNKLYCLFLSYTINVYDEVLKNLQAEDPRIHKLRGSLHSVMRNILSRFVKPAAMVGKSVDEVMYKEQCNQKVDNDLVIGNTAKEFIRNKEKNHLRDSRIKEFFSAVRQYFVNACNYIKANLPLNEPVLLHAEVADTDKQSIVKQSSIEFFLERFPCLIPKGSSKDVILEQFLLRFFIFYLNYNGKKRTRRSPKKKQQQNETQGSRDRLDSDSSSKPSSEVSGSEKKKGKDTEKRKLAEQSDDMTMCRLILTEMEKHDDGWPFLKPVNFKQFPTYKKYIKQPMDFTTMKNKLRDNLYQTRGDFASDARLVFNNCQTFNEDESEVGRAGHSMRKFFDNRWKELLLTSVSNDDLVNKESTSNSTETPVKDKNNTETAMES
ncbi:hypothetical protein KUTeg_015546 [Tegillarca granosa]|uniref:Bromodomain adjacent to zinc finger domain protein 2B n=1 Tax=Tegillarca granosa TaxID=220873 RepID=A0ABQ9EQD4_TEGGR|nr:hypothetical protein KUTeg_015546 [Tegillarca granosa]